MLQPDGIPLTQGRAADMLKPHSMVSTTTSTETTTNAACSDAENLESNVGCDNQHSDANTSAFEQQTTTAEYVSASDAMHTVSALDKRNLQTEDSHSSADADKRQSDMAVIFAAHADAVRVFGLLDVTGSDQGV